MTRNGIYRDVLFLAQIPLLACPYCGETSVGFGYHPMFHTDVDWCYMECMLCGARGPWATNPSDAARNWNRRSV